MAMQGVVGIPNTNAVDGTNPIVPQGKQGELLKADLHGKWWSAAYRGRVFVGGTAAAGTTIPISSATAATFVLFNPLGSGINVELISYDLGITVVTSVASPVLLGIITGLVLAPTGLTALTASPALLGGSSVAQAKLYSVATLAAAATLFYTLGQITATNATAGNALGPNFHYEFEGRIGLAPGSLVHVCGTAAQTSPTTQTFAWAEWPAP